MKNYLHITRSYPPFSGGGVQRMVKFARYLEDFGWKAKVVCPKPGPGAWVDMKRMKEVEHIEEVRIGTKAVKRDLVTRVKQRLHPVDPNFGWAKEVINQLKKEDLSTFDLIFTSGPPHSVHHVGYRLSQQFNMKWVADFRDPYTLGPEYKVLTPLHEKYDLWFERKIYEKADHIITNTKINKEEVLVHFGETYGNKISTIYNGFDLEDLKINPINLDWDKKKKHYIYLGGLRGDKVDSYFYNTIAEAIKIAPHLREELVIHLVGDLSRKGALIEELGIQDVFDFIGPVAYNNVGVYLKHSDAGLTWQRDRPRYAGTIAGKVFDYIGMKKPIYSLGQDNGEIARILKNYQIGISANPKKLKLAAKLFLEFHKGLKQKLFSYEVFNSELKQKFERYKQAKSLADIFDTLTKDVVSDTPQIII